jgi:hypothetical protein
VRGVLAAVRAVLALQEVAAEALLLLVLIDASPRVALLPQYPIVAAIEGIHPANLSRESLTIWKLPPAMPLSTLRAVVRQLHWKSIATISQLLLN